MSFSIQRGENVRLVWRWISKRPVESVLLILGIALGIGAASAGLSLFIDTVRQTNELRNSTKYREIEVTSREKSSDMELPALALDTEEFTVLTSGDLEAKHEMQGVEYAFIADRRRFDLRTENFGPGPEGGPPPAEDGPVPAAETPQDSTAAGGDEAPPEDFRRRFEVPEIDGPEPVLDEIYGYQVTTEFFPANDLYAETGSTFTGNDMAEGEPVMILGADLAKKLFEDGESYGRQVYSRPMLYTITGILKPTGTDYDTMAFIPSIIPDFVLADTQMARIYFSRNPSTLHFVISDPEMLDESKAQLTAWFDLEHGEDMVTITLPREETESVISRNKRISIIILFLAISGLLIADINVSNILLGRMIRTRKKIGVLKALGASKGQIFDLFSFEGLLLSSIGAIVGGAAAYLIFRVMESTMSLSGFSILQLLAGIIFAWIVTMLLTIIPALQAAKVPAADAMRNE